jgi:sedoheptulokinase
MLKDFYAQVAEQFTGKRPSDKDLYDKMCETAAPETGGLSVRTTFEGTRQNPSLRGEISGIDLRNLTPERLTTALLKGICAELKDFYDRMPEEIRRCRKNVTGSGNGLRKNPLLQKLFSDTFGLPLELTSNTEEAALGAALSALIK